MYHKDLEVYKKSIEFVKDIYQITAKYPREEQFGLVSQMRRAAVSIPSNIAEGNARFSDRDTSRFVDMALGSLAEVDTQLLLSLELNFIAKVEYSYLLVKVQNIQALLVGLRNFFKSKEKEKE